MEILRGKQTSPLLCLAVGLLVFGVSHTVLGQTQNDEGEALAPHEEAMYDAIRTSAEATRALLDEGFDPNHKFGNRSPLLHFAITAGAPDSEAIVRVLLDYGADPNLTDRGGFTAVHRAAGFSHGGYTMTKLLLERGGDPLRKTNAPEDGGDGLTPYDFALLHGFLGAQRAIEEVTDYRPDRYEWRKNHGILRGEFRAAFENSRNDKQRKLALKSYFQKQFLHGLISRAEADAQFAKAIEREAYKPLERRSPENRKRVLEKFGEVIQ